MDHHQNGQAPYGSHTPYLNEPGGSQYHYQYPDPSIAAQRYDTDLGFELFPNVQNQGPYVHEGFVPNTTYGQDTLLSDADYDQYAFPAFAQSSDEDDDEPDDDDPSEADDEELQRIADAVNNDKVDPDYDDTREEIMADADGLVSDEDNSDDEDYNVTARGRGRGRGRPRGRGRGRGRGASRGRGRPRGRPRGSGRGGLSRGQQDEEGRRTKKGPQPGPEPGRAFKAIETKATTSFFKNNLDEALEYAKEAIQADPSLLAGHSLLSEILLAMGRKVDAVHVLFNGALTKRDVNLWEHIAERYEELPSLSKAEKLKWRLLCYSKIIQIDGANYEARVEKLKIELETQNYLKAFNTCKKMLALRPGDAESLSQFAELCTHPLIIKKQVKLKKAVQCFDNSFAHFMENDDPETSDLDWPMLNIYLDIMLAHDQNHPAALSKLSFVSRWILGRGEEQFWTSQSDDREWDVGDERRRFVEDFEPGLYPSDAYGNGLPLELRLRMGIFRLHMGAPHFEEAYRHFAFLEGEDGILHTETLSEYYEPCLEIAKALKQHGLYQTALKYFEGLRDTTSTVEPEVYRGLIGCFRALNRLTAAGECVHMLRESGIEDVRSRALIAKHLQDTNKKEEAHEIAKDLLKRQGAEAILREEGVEIPKSTRIQMRRGTRFRFHRNRETTMPRKIPMAAIPEDLLDALGIEPGQEVEWDVEKYRKLGKFMQRYGPEQHIKIKEAKTRDQMIRELGQHLEVLTMMLDDNDEDAVSEYLEIAKIMVDDFANCKAFFPQRDKRMSFTGYHVPKRADQNADDAALELAELAGQLADEEGTTITDTFTIPDTFHGIKFEDWLGIFCRYSFILAKVGQLEECWRTLSVANNANVFLKNKELMQQLYACWLASGLLLNDEGLISQACRLYMKALPFASDTFRLYSIANRLYSGPRTHYNSGPWLKWMLRQVKITDYALLPPDQRRRYNFEAQDHLSFALGAADGNPHGLRAHDISMLICYSHMLIMGGSYITALNYYFRAYALRPRDPTINLCIGLCYMQNGLKSKVDNRQYHLQQGLAFVYRYYDIRMASKRALHRQEAEFNVGRVWHMLGLTHLAVPCYEKVLEMSEAVCKEQDEARARAGAESDDDEDDEDVGGYEDFSKEAAFAMQMILAINEDFTGAREITKKWLVIE